ncbi:MAG TPA: hypothetical protein VF755_08105 [Catenuloplanes sp.]
MLGGSVTLLPTAAQAADAGRSCYAFECTVSTYSLTGGTVSVSVNISGRGTGHWVLSGPRGYRCEADVDQVAPMRTWTCRNAPAGTLTLNAHAESGQRTIDLIIRW